MTSRPLKSCSEARTAVVEVDEATPLFADTVVSYEVSPA